jgi:hypothetical protein
MKPTVGPIRRERLHTTVGIALRATQQTSVHLAGVMEESLLAHKEVAEAIRRHDGPGARLAIERLVRHISH